MRLKEWLYQLFYFNKQERNGVFVLCSIIVILVVVKLTLSLWAGNSHDIKLITFSSSANETNLNNEILNKTSLHSLSTFSENKISAEYFVFNPNTISATDAEKLGFSKKLVSTLVNFRSKGGKFFKPEDLKKLYGITPQLYESLESYILIPYTEKEFKSQFKTDSSYKKHTTYAKYEKKTFHKEPIDINQADSLSIVSLKGIGPAFTKRIIKYRTLLGGFHSVHQLREVYGMTDSLFNAIESQIVVNKNTITKLPINSIDFNSLRKHPYFNYASAQAIINFKFKHGKLTEQDVKSLGVFSEDKLQLILPYLNY